MFDSLSIKYICSYVNNKYNFIYYFLTLYITLTVVIFNLFYFLLLKYLYWFYNKISF